MNVCANCFRHLPSHVQLLQVMFGKSQGEQSARERDLSCTSLEEMSIYISQSHQRALSISVNFI